MLLSSWRPLALSLFVLAATSSSTASRASDFEFLRVPRSASETLRPAPKYQFMYGVPGRWPGPVRWRYNHANAPSPFDAGTT